MRATNVYLDLLGSFNIIWKFIQKAVWFDTSERAFNCFLSFYTIWSRQTHF